MFPHPPQPSLTPVTAGPLPFHLSASHTHSSTPPSFPPHHHTFICHGGTRNRSMSQGVFFCPDSFTRKHSSQWLTWFDFSGLQQVINTGPLQRLASDVLLLPRVRVMSQLGRAWGWGWQVSCELLAAAHLPVSTGVPSGTIFALAACWLKCCDRV